MTLYLRHYWQDDRLAFPSSNNKSRTFDARLVKKIWVPDVFFVHSKRSFIHDTTMENIMLRVFPDGNILYSVRYRIKPLFLMLFQTPMTDFLSRHHVFQSETSSFLPGITTVLTMSTIITGVSASMPQVSYVKAVDIYLWASFLFVFLSVIEYAAVNYFTTVEEMKKLQKGKLPASYDATQAMAYDGCFHDDIDASPFPELPTTPSTTRTIPARASSTEPPPTEGTRLWRKRSVGKNIRFIMSNSYMIDSYSRILFPLAYLLFNIIYWCIYS